MKQNNGKDYILYIFLLLFTLAFCWLEYPEALAEPRSDAVTAMRWIASSSVTSDWHELLFVYEGRVLRQIAKLPFFHMDLEFVKYLMIFMWYVVTIMLYCMLCLLFLSMKKHRGTLFVFIVFFISSFAFIRHHNYALFHKYIDGYFYPFIISALIGVRFALASTGKKRFAWFIFVLFCLFHCVGYRRVAYILLPAFFYILTPLLIKAKGFFPRIFTALACSCCFGISTILLFRCIPAIHEHPTTIMMYSDMTNAKLLSEDKEAFQTLLKNVHVTGHVNEKNKITYDTFHQWFCIHFIKPDTEENWNSFVKTYIDCVRNHPKEMFVGRVISLVQFYSNMHVPMFIRKAITSYCPQAQLDEKVWAARMWMDSVGSGGKYEKIYLFFLSACVLVLSFFRRNRLDANTRFFIFVSLVGFLYSMGYWIVTPTPDARYHAFTVMAQCMFLSYMAAKGTVAGYSFFRNRLNNNQQG